MSGKIKSKRLIVMLVIICVVLAVAFILSYFSIIGGRHNSEIVLPSPSATVSAAPEPVEDANTDVLTVDPSNVKNAVSTISRPSSYHRILETTINSAGLLSTTKTECWVSDTSQRFDIQSSNGLKHVLILDSIVYIWYDGEEDDVITFSISEYFQPDDYQSIPTYEDVLELPEDRITDADYLSSGEDAGAIYVQFQSEDQQYTDMYWISLETGLLTQARTLYNGELVYDMAETYMELLPGSHEVFDGVFTPPAAS